MQPSKIIKRSDLKIFFQTFVYAWWKKGVCLYVGATNTGYRRLISHNVIGVSLPFEEDDEIHLYYCPYDEVYHLEAKLISEFRPKFTARSPFTTEAGKLETRECPRCHNNFTQKRLWQVYCSTRCSRVKKLIDLNT